MSHEIGLLLAVLYLNPKEEKKRHNPKLKWRIIRYGDKDEKKKKKNNKGNKNKKVLDL